MCAASRKQCGICWISEHRRNCVPWAKCGCTCGRQGRRLGGIPPAGHWLLLRWQMTGLSCNSRCVVQLFPLARLHFLVSIFLESLLAAVFALVRAPTRHGTGYVVACSMVEGKGFACCRAAGSASCRPERAGPYQSPPVACRSGCMWRWFGHERFAAGARDSRNVMGCKVAVQWYCSGALLSLLQQQQLVLQGCRSVHDTSPDQVETSADPTSMFCQQLIGRYVLWHNLLFYLRVSTWFAALFVCPSLSEGGREGHTWGPWGAPWCNSAWNARPT